MTANSSIETMAAPLALLAQTTATLQAALAGAELDIGALIDGLRTVTTTAETLMAIGPTSQTVPGLYVTWSDLVLALVALQERDLDATAKSTLASTIAVVRQLRRHFNLAPGGA
jgi:hypothetical protein